MLSPDRVTVELANKEALVLLEHLRRRDDQGSSSFLDPAEEKALWMLEGKLESQLVEILSPDCAKFLKEARDEVRDRE